MALATQVDQPSSLARLLLGGSSGSTAHLLIGAMRGDLPFPARPAHVHGHRDVPSRRMARRRPARSSGARDPSDAPNSVGHRDGAALWRASHGAPQPQVSRPGRSIDEETEGRPVARTTPSWARRCICVIALGAAVLAAAASSASAGPAAGRAAHPPTSFWVAPGGSDAWPGTAGKPFATLHAGARRGARPARRRAPLSRHHRLRARRPVQAQPSPRPRTAGFGPRRPRGGLPRRARRASRAQRLDGGAQRRLVALAGRRLARAGRAGRVPAALRGRRPRHACQDDRLACRLSPRVERRRRRQRHRLHPRHRAGPDSPGVGRPGHLDQRRPTSRPCSRPSGR